MKRMGKIAAALIAVCTLFSGASVAVADQAAPSANNDQQEAPAATGRPAGYGQVSVSNVHVSDVGAYTANVSFNYSIDPALLPQIKNVCFAIDVQRITEITATAAPSNQYAFGWNDVSCNGVEDEDLTQALYKQIYGVRTEPVVDIKGETVGSATYQSFTRYDKDSWNGSASGTFNMALIGLIPNTTYGNHNLGEFGQAPLNVNLWQQTDKVYKQGGHSSDVDFGQIYAGLRIELKNGDFVPFDSSFGSATQMSDFTTTAEPASKPTTPDLTEQNKGNVTVPDGVVKPGSVARIYVENLAKECAAKVDASEDCFWYSYIYSDPVRLTGPDGSPFVTIKKDKDGKYYYDAFIPANYSGEHKIALQDDKGNIQGWTDVTVGEKTPTPTPAPVDKTALNNAIAAASKLVKTDYTEASWAPFATALEAAKTVAGKADAKQADVDAAVTQLAAAQAALKKAEQTPSKDEHGNEAGTDTTKPNTEPKPDTDKKPVQEPAKTDTKKQTLPKGGAGVIAVVAAMVMLAAAGAVCVIRRRA